MKESLYKLPPAFLSKLKKIYPNHFTRICQTFLVKRGSSFRINHGKIDLVSLRKRLVQEKVRCKELPFPKGAFLLKMPLRDFQRKRLYEEGEIFVQNVSSMLPVGVLDPQNGEKILDLCAAPGAKTSQIASLAPEAKIVAIEKNRIRYYKLLANLKGQGVEGVQAHIIDGMWVRKKFPEEFDKILVDAPCSAEGRFVITNPKSYRYWKERKVKEMVHTQKKLMHSAFFALRPGGHLVYSTCTFSPEENEGIVSWFLEKFHEKVEALPIRFPLSPVVAGMKAWKGKRFFSGTHLSVRVIPNEFMEGFFVAHFKKSEE